ncbi:MAG: gamma-glutamyltransferase, partial [Pseudomonadota bacterium]
MVNELARPSAATIHTSAADTDGLACAITASAGYGAGISAPGTGLWLNNCLGELELNRRGRDVTPPGARLPSNMAPTVAWRPNQVLSIGSPGADRITSAMAQVLVRFLSQGQTLADAIAAPRWHVDVALAPTNGHFSETLCSEPGAIDSPPDDMSYRAFEAPGMYFGGVGAVNVDLSTQTLLPVADNRRTGATVIDSA